MSRIWKQASVLDEIMQGMESNQLEAVAKEENKENELILLAMQELNAAAESFENAGKKARAAEVTAVMMSLADDEDRNDSKKTQKPWNKQKSKNEARETFKMFGFSDKDLNDVGFSSDEEDGENDD